MPSKKGQKVRQLGKELSKAIDDHVAELTDEHKRTDTPKDRKKVIDLKLRMLRHLKVQLDDVGPCTFDGGVVDLFDS